MNPLTNMKNQAKMNEKELEMGVAGNLKKSWHWKYRDSAWIFMGGLPYELTEGDLLAVFSQWGEVVNINLIRDHKTGKSKGFGFLCYEDQRSTILAVDNFNGIKLVGRLIRVDHVEEYRVPKDHEDVDEETRRLWIEGCGPQMEPPPKDVEPDEEPDKKPKKVKKEKKAKKKKSKKEKKAKKKRKKKRGSDSDSDSSSEEDKKSLKREMPHIEIPLLPLPPQLAVKPVPIDPERTNRSWALGREDITTASFAHWNFGPKKEEKKDYPAPTPPTLGLDGLPLPKRRRDEEAFVPSRFRPG